MKTISVSLHNRPQYTKILLDHLDRCNNIEEYAVVFCCEPTNDEVISLAKNFRPQRSFVIINPKPYGCNLNIFQCLAIGFDNNDFHIHLEDDTIPAKDFLVYCEWAKNQYINDQTIFSISGYVNINNKTEHYSQPSDNIHLIKRRNWFTPWGWATWRNRWDSVKNELYNGIITDTKYSWDHLLHRNIKDKYEVYPAVSRIQNIGAENGTYVPNPQWHKSHQYNEFWLESLGKTTDKFIEEI